MTATTTTAPAISDKSAIPAGVVPATSIDISILGVTARIRCTNPQVMYWLDFDFSQFVLEAPLPKCDINVDVFVQEPPENIIPPLDEIMHTPKFVVFENEHRTRYITYQDKAICIHNYVTETGTIYCAEPTEAYERLYLTILSRVGERLDSKGIHRVHSLGVSYKNQATVMLIPQGGGKTTLALSLLGKPGIKLISEDTPFINARGQVLPFPFRLGVTNGERTEAIPEQYKRLTGRMHWGFKILVDLRYFKDSIAHDAMPLKFLLCGRWTNKANPRIAPLGKIGALGYLMRDCVFGLGLPQVIELFLQSGLRGTSQKALIAFSRLFVSIITVLKTNCYQLYLCKDREQNARMIVDFLESQAKR
jgi:hypothetical protein